MALQPYARLELLGRVKTKPSFGKGRVASVYFIAEVLTELGEPANPTPYRATIPIKAFGPIAEDLEDDRLREGDIVQALLRVETDVKRKLVGSEWVTVKDEDNGVVFTTVYVADAAYGFVRLKRDVELDETGARRAARGNAPGDPGDGREACRDGGRPARRRG